MKKFLSIMVALAILTGATAGGCDEKKCEPGSIRQDATGSYHVCNQDGKSETQYDNPNDYDPHEI
jgi:hypothetical protein